MAGWNPNMFSVILTPINTPKQLSALIAALSPNFSTRLSSLWLQMDLASTGNVYMGGAAVTSINCGYNFVAGLAFALVPAENAMILTTDIYLSCTVVNAQMNIIAQPITM